MRCTWYGYGGVMPSEREEAAIVEYVRRLESGEEVQQELVIPEE